MCVVSEMYKQLDSSSTVCCFLSFCVANNNFGKIQIIKQIGAFLILYQPASNIGPIRVPYGILYGSNMGNPSGTDKSLATRFHTGPTWANHLGHKWEPYGSFFGFGPSGPYPASICRIDF